jgi:hypothetical protein
MKTNSNAASRWITVVIFATAMAWVESAVVYYLRSLIHRIEPYQPYPLPVAGGFGFAEAVREFATMVMLLTVGILAGRNWKSRLGYAAIAFGVWDIFYYVFLKVMCGWPHSLLDWDILFLLPLPWWGPVLAPVSIALLMILWGTVVSSWRIERARDGLEWKAWALNFLGVILALYLFMADSIRVANGGVDALRNVLPQWFNWPLFCVALVLMAAPILELLWRWRGAVTQTKTATLVDGDWEYASDRGPSFVKSTLLRQKRYGGQAMEGRRGRIELKPVKVLSEQGK